MKFVLALGLLFSLNVFAANKPENFDAAKWDQLINKVFEKGDVMTIQAGELRYLSDITPKDGKDKGISHHAEYVSILGQYVNRAQYLPQDISAVDEHWQTTDGSNWTVDQWTYNCSVSGDLLRVGHNRMVQKDGMVLSYESLETPAATSPEMLKQWGAKLDEWLDRAAKF